MATQTPAPKRRTRATPAPKDNGPAAAPETDTAAAAPAKKRTAPRQAAPTPAQPAVKKKPPKAKPVPVTSADELSLAAAAAPSSLPAPTPARKTPRKAAAQATDPTQPAATPAAEVAAEVAAERPAKGKAQVRPKPTSKTSRKKAAEPLAEPLADTPAHGTAQAAEDPPAPADLAAPAAPAARKPAAKSSAKPSMKQPEKQPDTQAGQAADQPAAKKPTRAGRPAAPAADPVAEVPHNAPAPAEPAAPSPDAPVPAQPEAAPPPTEVPEPEVPAEAAPPVLAAEPPDAEPGDPERPTGRRGQRPDATPGRESSRDSARPPRAERTAPRTPEASAPLLLPAADAPAHSRLLLADLGALRRLRWVPGQGQPLNLAEALAPHLDATGHLATEDDAVVPLLLRLAAEGRHAVQVAPEVWPFLAAHRDARTRCAVLAQAHPAGPASPALQSLLAVGLPAFQAEGALWAVAAGRALLADAPGLGKGVQALAAAQLWRRHFGLRRVLVLCAPAEALAWQRAWQRLAGLPAQVMTGALQHRQALWHTEAEVRVITPDALASDAAHLQAWAPELLLVDEPQHLGLDAQAWARLDAPHALVLCGAALEHEPELLDTLVDWLDTARLGPLAALREVRAARDGLATLDEAGVERVSAQLSRVLLQRQAAEVRGQLPGIVYSSRLVTLSDGQRQAHAQARQLAQRLLSAWQASGVLSDADQWRLSQAVVAMQQAGRREAVAPGAPSGGTAGSAPDTHTNRPAPLAEAMVQALDSLLAQDPAGAPNSTAEADAPARATAADTAAEAPPEVQTPASATEAPANTEADTAASTDTEAPNEIGTDASAPTGPDAQPDSADDGAGAPPWAVLCEHEADCAQLAQRLGPRPGVHLIAPGQALPAGPLRLVQVGAPWRLRQRPLTRGRAAGSGAGQRWFSLVAADSLDLGLMDTLGLRLDTPVGPAEAGSRGFLSGAARQAWLHALAAALQAIEA